MSDRLKDLDVGKVLAGLKDFQRASVDYVFQRMYLDAQPARRFLIADEVGLGKTLVARGLIAKTIEHLRERVSRIDIVYICSNSDIARQNISRLNVLEDEDFAEPTRITMLPVGLKELKSRPLNMVSLTPGTSFELKTSLGRIEERALIYWLLKEAWNLSGKAALNVLQGNAKKDNFRYHIEQFNGWYDIDHDLGAAFRKAVDTHVAKQKAEGQTDLRIQFEQLCEQFGRARENISTEERDARAAVIGELRGLLAATCIEALEPDLIILDEFQRFKHLLDGTDEASSLARVLFEYPDTRVLLLSATPYKMYTLDEESGTEDHYADFLRTYGFLQNQTAQTERVATLLREYRHEVMRIEDGDLARLRVAKKEIETHLRAVMVRTERLAVTEDRNGMLEQASQKASKLTIDDLHGYLQLQRVSRLLDEDDPLEYWKSSPYLLNFMDGYSLKTAFDEMCEERDHSSLAKELGTFAGGLLSWTDIAKYKAIDPGNARLRELWDQMLGGDLWRCLWIPPAAPYYRLQAPFPSNPKQGFTKRLVFSSWRVVPKVIAGLMSYGAERLMMSSLDAGEIENSPEARKRRTPLLRFAKQEGRLTGMPVLGILYPSISLARECDPMALVGNQKDGQLPSLDEVLENAAEQIRPLLARARDVCGKRLITISDTGPVDDAWYWMAPILFDYMSDREATRAWLTEPDCANVWSGVTDDTEEEETVWAAHVDQARKVVQGGCTLGRQPDDLVKVLSLMAVAGPGVCALRALARMRGTANALEDDFIRDAGGRIAWGLRTLFNLPEAMAVVRGINREEPYWLRVLEYCAAGGLQSVLDEYVHCLRESSGLLDRKSESAAPTIADEVGEALGVRAGAVAVDVITSDESSVTRTTQRLRARFAARFGDQETEDEAVLNRVEAVRKAFNSPFWPFVLATTSVGQEGLDFHPYCHAIVHWNLPANPVDLEQREGRIHRYKGHAVRKNVAQRYGIPQALGPHQDPWEVMFESARRDREVPSDLVPYWVYAIEGGAKIERHVLALPLSRDLDRLIELRKALAVYRMAFGQARQEELVSYLLSRLPKERISALMEELQMDLSPSSSGP